VLRAIHLAFGAPRPAAAGALLLLAVLAVGCSREQAPPPRPVEAVAPRCEPLARAAPPTRRSVVFVLSDTLRSDRLGIDGGPAHTPRFDAFAAGGLHFTAATSQAPWTKPSVATLFTGLLPSTHGVVSHPALRRDGQRLESDVLGVRHHTLAESLAAAGYQTAAFVSNPWLQRKLGFDQGFETWDESMADNATPGERVTAAGLRWLREREGDPRPFFLYLHYMDAHSPYHGVPAATLAARREALAADARPLTPDARREIASIARDAHGRPLADQGVEPSLAVMELVYDVGVERFDHAFGVLLDGLERRDDWGELAVVVTSDHGEALFERGYREHGFGLHGDEISVPLAARLPGVPTRGAISCPVGLIDLRRTLCDYLGVECLGDDQGTSLFSPDAAASDRLVVSESVVGRPHNRAVRDARYKLLFEPDGSAAVEPGGASGSPVRFYDLADDPGETHDLAAEGVPEPLRERFERLRTAAEASSAGPRAEAETTGLDDATRRRLEALGYLDPAD